MIKVIRTLMLPTLMMLVLIFVPNLNVTKAMSVLDYIEDMPAGTILKVNKELIIKPGSTLTYHENRLLKQRMHTVARRIKRRIFGGGGMEKKVRKSWTCRHEFEINIVAKEYKKTERAIHAGTELEVSKVYVNVGDSASEERMIEIEVNHKSIESIQIRPKRMKRLVKISGAEEWDECDDKNTKMIRHRKISELQLMTGQVISIVSFPEIE